jgi:predicted permease
MGKLRALLSRFNDPLIGERQDRELALELDAHLQMLTDDNIRAGVSPEEARRQARIALGGVESVKENCRDRRGLPLLESLSQDLCYAFRILRRSPGFTLVALATLALGIGATTAIFTLIDAVLLKSLPVRDPNALVVLGDGRGSGVSGGGQSGSFTLYSWDLYKHLRDTTQVFDDLCAFNSEDEQIAVGRARSGATQPARAKLVSGNYFGVLGINAAVGRAIAPADDSPSARPVAVVSFRQWKEAFNGDASVVGSIVNLNRLAVTIVGVAPPGFYGETLQADPPSFWLPISAVRQLDPAWKLIDEPEEHWLYLIGRLKPGISWAQTDTRLTAALQNWLVAQAGSALPAERRAEISKSYIHLSPGGSGIGHMRQQYSRTLQLLLGIAGIALLITCANIANLLLARGDARRAERSLRLALGAGRARLFRQSLTESLVLALAGGILGLLIASMGTKMLIALTFHGTEYVPIRIAPDTRVLAFSLALSFATAIVFGLAPAIRFRSELASDIRTFRLSRRRFGLTSALIAGQVALSLVVLAGAGSFARSLANLSNQRFGFDRERVLIVNIDPAGAGYEYNRLGPLYRQIGSRLNALPGVKNASLSYYSPFNGCCWGHTITVDGYTPKPEEKRGSDLNRVSPRYFETLGTKLLSGRTIDERDTPASPRVAVVTEAFVRRFFPNQYPVGKRFGIGRSKTRGRANVEIAGVVEDSKYDEPGAEQSPIAFLPLFQLEPVETAMGPDDIASNFIGTIEVRATGSPASIAGQVRSALAEIDPGLPVLRVDTLADQVDRTLNQENVIADLAGFFGLLALVLTCVGLYGLMAWVVQRRTSEIGIRIALGARRNTVLGAVMREAMVQVVAGMLIGVPAAFVAIRLVANLLYGVSPADPGNSAVAGLVLILCVAVAAYLPARRAAQIDPMEALRYE